VSSLSTHVLDIDRGAPAIGMRVSLFRGQDRLAESRTGDTGRIADMGGGDLEPGTYRLVFDVANYLSAQDRPAPFLQRVSLEFRVEADQPHYHVPLLLSPYACTSYRGS
jgi:5-hydroxyisourate hydrolase